MCFNSIQLQGKVSRLIHFWYPDQRLKYATGGDLVLIASHPSTNTPYYNNTKDETDYKGIGESRRIIQNTATRRAAHRYSRQRHTPRNAPTHRLTVQVGCR
jgi:hypothetical protein